MKVGLITGFLLSALWQCCVAPPVSKNQEPSPEDLQLIMHYHRYLTEVVSVLEKDPEFRKKIDSAKESDITSGNIANELEFVSHHVRNQLDELKRQELLRLKTLNREQNEVNGNINLDDPSHGHIDHSNPHTFEVADLKKLITKTMQNIEEHDKKRRENFKTYELEKEYQKFEKLNHTNGEEKEKLEKEFQEREERHKKHEPLHEPGHKAQFEEVWEEQDQMKQEFNPKAFFMMHDLDSNGLWDQDEVKALFIKELNKMYDKNAPEDDMVERAEEMERMRETVFKQIDTNLDGFIDFDEFLAQTKREDYQEDHGWKGLDEEKPYSDEELEAYIREQQRLHPPPYYPPPGAYHPNAPPPPHAYNPNMPPPGAYHPQGNPQYQPPPPQYHNQGNIQSNDINQQQQQPGSYAQPPVQNIQQPVQNQGAPQPPAANQGQLPPPGNQGQLPQGQVPQGQLPPAQQLNQGQVHQLPPSQQQQPESIRRI